MTFILVGFKGKIHLHAYILTQLCQQANQVLHKYLPQMGQMLKGEWLNLRQLLTQYQESLATSVTTATT